MAGPVAQRRRGSSCCFRVDDLIGFAFKARDAVSVVILFRDWYDVFFPWLLVLSSAEEDNTSQEDHTKKVGRKKRLCAILKIKKRSRRL